jgi:hypothetical protein
MLSCAAGIISQETRRIKFARGRSAATVRGSVLREETITYLVNAGEGQRMRDSRKLWLTPRSCNENIRVLRQLA